MIYDYRYTDEEGGEFASDEMRLKEHNGRPCGRIFTTNFGFKEGNVPWPDREHKGMYTTVSRKNDGTLKVKK